MDEEKMQELLKQHIHIVAGGHIKDSSALAADINHEIAKGCIPVGTELDIETDYPLIQFKNDAYTTYPLIDLCNQKRGSCKVKYILTCDMREINKRKAKQFFDNIAV
jgi:hypothetical protein